MDKNLLGLMFSFEQMLTIRVIKVVYFLGLGVGAITLLISVGRALQKMGRDAGAGVGSLVIALVLGAMGFLVWRIVCESLIIAFGIYDRLGEIRDQGGTRGAVG